jgi:FlaG protein
MRFDPPPVGAARDAAASGPQAPQTPRNRRPDKKSFADVMARAIPSEPPRALLPMIERAAARPDELAAANRELHFTRDPLTGRVVAQVRDLEGRVVREIPPSLALDIAGGAGLD